MSIENLNVNECDENLMMIPRSEAFQNNAPCFRIQDTRVDGMRRDRRNDE